MFSTTICICIHFSVLRGCYSRTIISLILLFAIFILCKFLGERNTSRYLMICAHSPKYIDSFLDGASPCSLDKNTVCKNLCSVSETFHQCFKESPNYDLAVKMFYELSEENTWISVSYPGFVVFWVFQTPCIFFLPYFAFSPCHLFFILI